MLAGYRQQMKQLILFLLGSALLSGCATGVTLLQSQSAARYTSFSSGQIPMVVHGNPFGGSKPDFSRAAASAAQKLLRNPSLEFSVQDDASSLSQVHAILAFNAPQSQSPWNLCGGKSVDAIVSDGGKLNLLVAICNADKAMGWAIAAASDATSVQSPSFQTLVSQAAEAAVQPSIRRHGQANSR